MSKIRLEWENAEIRDKVDDENIKALLIISFAVAFAVFIFVDFISALVLIAASLTIAVYFKFADEAIHKRYIITSKGIKVNNILYPFENVLAFNIYDDPQDGKLLIVKLNNPLTPYIVSNVDDVLEDDLRLILSAFAKEDNELVKPVEHMIAKKLKL